MKVGDRVITSNGSIGHIEAIIDNDFADIRYLTPNNAPSCCVGLCWLKHLKKVEENVVPMPKSDEWWQEAKAFHSLIELAINENEEKP